MAKDIAIIFQLIISVLNKSGSKKKKKGETNNNLHRSFSVCISYTSGCYHVVGQYLEEEIESSHRYFPKLPSDSNMQSCWKTTC